MARFNLLAVLLLASMMLSAFPLAVAGQSDPDDDDDDPPVDIELVESELMLIASDPQAVGALAVALETPPVSADLPPGFLEATYFDPNVEQPEGVTRGQQGLLQLDELFGQGIDDSVAYFVEGDPSVLSGSVHTATLTYVIVNPLQFVDDPATQEVESLESFMLDLETSIEENFQMPTTGEVRRVDPTEVDDNDDDGDESQTLAAELDGLLATYTLAQGGASGAAQLYIVPVGNVFIFSLVTVGDQEPVDPAALQAPAENLALAGIEHLETAVVTLTQP